MSLKERVGRLERARGAGGCQIISIRGGFGDDLETASADGLTLRRQPGEERPAFVERNRCERGTWEYRARAARLAELGGVVG
jgi:hypothetical protein